ncbi:MAG: alpha-hydroxy acid oxidase [Halocynthiibacter sp.]
MDLDTYAPAISDLKARSRRRIPHFVWEYLESATGRETTMMRNRTALDDVLLQPSVLHGAITPDLTAQLMGRTYPLPFGIAPVGMSGLVWPGAERTLAALAAKSGIPYCLSTVASQAPESIGPLCGDQGWFQLYLPRDAEIRHDLLRRARDAGFHTLVLTVDVPAPSRRERQRRSGLQTPPRLTPRLLAQIACCPAWALGTLRHGKPRLRGLERYVSDNRSRPSTEHIGYLLRDSPDWEDLKALRDEWQGPLVIKGVLDAGLAQRICALGVDAIWVSNHAGRQFDAAPATISVLPDVRAAVGPDMALIFDSGAQDGLDIMRALALGANFVMMGRAFHYGLGAFGARGAAHVVNILREDMIANMGQLGARTLGDLAARRL